MIGGLQKAFPGAEIDVPDGWVELKTKEDVANILGHPEGERLAKQVLRGGAFKLRSWCHIDCPIKGEWDPVYVRTTPDGTTKFAPVRREDMAAAVRKLRHYILKRGGYDIIAGFSQGGFLISQLAKEVVSLNKELSALPNGKPIEGMLINGVSFVPAYGFAYEKIDGTPGERLEAKASLRAVVMAGDADTELIAQNGIAQELEYHTLGFDYIGFDTLKSTFPGRHQMPPADNPFWAEVSDHLWPNGEHEGDGTVSCAEWLTSVPRCLESCMAAVVKDVCGIATQSNGTAATPAASKAVDLV